MDRIKTGRRSPHHHSYLLTLWSIVIFSIGCASDADTSWTLRSEVLELPAVQQSEIENVLTQIYGTFGDPRMRSLAPESDEEDESVGDETTDGLSFVDTVDPLKLQRGRNVYMKYCSGCHGAAGDGNGPAAEYLNPPPRDYRPGVFKFTSTPDNYKPRREDLRLVIRRGAKGTSMPAFRWLSDEDMEALVDYVILLSRRGELELALLREASEYDPEDFEDEESVAEFRELAYEWIDLIDERWKDATNEIVRPAVPEPPRTEETILAGQALFFDKQQGCYKCHGADGRGGIEDDASNKDAWGQPIVAANLTTGMYHGGARPIDLFRRIHSGITSRMPAFGSVFEDDPEKIWHLVHYVQAIGEGRDVPDIEIPADHESEEGDGDAAADDNPESE